MAAKKQSTSQVSQKLGTMLIGLPVVQALVNPAVLEVWPQIMPAALTGPSMTALAAAIPSTLIMGIVASFVPDAVVSGTVPPLMRRSDGAVNGRVERKERGIGDPDHFGGDFGS